MNKLTAIKARADKAQEHLRSIGIEASAAHTDICWLVAEVERLQWLLEDRAEHNKGNPYGVNVFGGEWDVPDKGSPDDA